MIHYRLTASQRAFRAINYTFLFVLACVTFYPFYFIVIRSLSNPVEMVTAYFWPKRFFTFNYWFIIATSGIGRAYLVSLIRLLLGVPGMLLVTSAAAFVLTRKEMTFRKTIILYFFITMFFSGGLIPMYMTIRAVGLYNRFLVFVIPTLFSVWTMIVMKTIIQQLPEGLVEAALIDGAGYPRIYLSIILPLSKAMLATLGLFFAVGQWNEWFTGAFYVKDKNLWPLSTFLQIEVLKQGDTGWYGKWGRWTTTHPEWEHDPEIQLKLELLRFGSDSLDTASFVLGILPIVLLYPFLQRFFIKGVLIGSIKE